MVTELKAKQKAWFCQVVPSDGQCQQEGVRVRVAGASLVLIRHKGKLEKAGMSKHSYKWSANVRHSKSVRQDRDVTPQQMRLQLPVSIRKREIKIKIIHT